MSIFLILALIFTTISIVISVFSIGLHLVIRKMLKPPGELIFLQCIAQFFIDIHWFSILIISKHDEDGVLCQTLASFSVFFTSISMNYLVSLCIEVTIKLHNRSYVNYKYRKLAYHSLSLAYSSALIIIALIHGDLGISALGTCSTKPGTITAYMRQYSFFIEILTMLTLLIFIMRKIGKTYSNVILNYFFIIVSMSTLVLLTNLFKYLPVSQELQENIGMLLGSLTGIAIGVSRLSNRRLIKQIIWKSSYLIRKRMLKSSQVSEDSFRAEGVYFLGDLFDNLTLKSLLQMLTMTCLRFKDMNQSRYVEIEDEYAMYEYDEIIFDELAEKYQLARIKDIYAPDLYLIEYLPQHFKEIREKVGVTNQDLYRSFSISENIKNINNLHTEAGRSNATVFFTYDNMFVVKTITKKERKFLTKKLLIYYSKRVLENNSYLVKILGVFRVNPSGTDIIVMDNVVEGGNHAVSFDIKGSTVNRFVKGDFDYSNPPYGMLLKDLNLKQSGFKFYLNQETLISLKKALRGDIKMLSDLKIIDYSLLISFYKEEYKPKSRYAIAGAKANYTIGIIDYLQTFGTGKASERFIKKMFTRGGKISVEAPDLYKIRLFNEIESLLVANDE